MEDFTTLLSHGALRGLALGACFGIVYDSSSSRKEKGAGRMLVLGAFAGASLVVGRALYESEEDESLGLKKVQEAARSLVESSSENARDWVTIWGAGLGSTFGLLTFNRREPWVERALSGAACGVLLGLGALGLGWLAGECSRPVCLPSSPYLTQITCTRRPLQHGSLVRRVC